MDKHYAIESDFIHKGIRCVVVAYDMGHRCGYCEIKKGHILYGKGYSEDLSDIPRIKRFFNKIKRMPLGKRGVIPILCYKKGEISLDILIDVHGSVTFTGEGQLQEMEGDGWWIGFDCAHCDDARDPAIMKNLSMLSVAHLFKDGIIRTKEYVEQECKNLAEQLITINGGKA